MSSRIPPLLEPYLELPEEASLILLTSVLGAGTNWLVLRYLYSFLHRGRGGEEGGQSEDVGVVFVSFMRDLAFWKEGSGKLGLDLDNLSRTGKFTFVDGLTGLFTGSKSPVGPVTREKEGRVLRSDKLEDVKREIEIAMGDVRAQKKVLLVDGVDEWLAASGDGVSALGVENMLLSLREHVHATILTLPTDAPLIHSQATTLERSHAALALSQAHVADAVISLRMLDTGVARDVSGVMRISIRPDGGVAGEEKARQGGVEYLYYVGGDGGVKVFERGT